MSSPTTLSQENYRLKIQWNESPGVPEDLCKEAGAGYRTVKRNLTKDLSGQEDWRTPNVVSLPAAGAPNISDAIAVAAGIAGIVWKQRNFTSYRGRAEWTWGRIFKAAGNNQYLKGGNVFKRQMDGVVQRAENLYSPFIYGDGGGALARLDPNVAINPGDTTVQLLLPRTGINFESYIVNQDTGDKEGGDTVEFAPDKGTPSLPQAGVRPFRVRVAGISRTSGIMTLDQPIPETFPGSGVAVLVPGDYVFQASQYGRVIEGHAAWNPADSNVLAAPFHGVQRDSNPEKLGGLRVLIGAGQDPYPKLTAIREAMRVNGSRIDYLFTTPEEWSNIENSLESLARHGFKMVGGYGGGDAVKRTVNDKLKYGGPGNNYIKSGKIQYSFGHPMGLQFAGPMGNPVMVMCDEYLANVESGPDGQSFYRGWNSADWQMHGTVEGSYVWVNIDGNGPIYQQQDKELVNASYSIESIYTHKKTLNSCVAGPEGIVIP